MASTTRFQHFRARTSRHTVASEHPAARAIFGIDQPASPSRATWARTRFRPRARCRLGRGVCRWCAERA